MHFPVFSYSFTTQNTFLYIYEICIHGILNNFIFFYIKNILSFDVIIFYFGLVRNGNEWDHTAKKLFLWSSLQGQVMVELCMTRPQPTMASAKLGGLIEDLKFCLVFNLNFSKIIFFYEIMKFKKNYFAINRDLLICINLYIYTLTLVIVNLI